MGVDLSIVDDSLDIIRRLQHSANWRGEAAVQTAAFVEALQATEAALEQLSRRVQELARQLHGV